MLPYWDKNRRNKTIHNKSYET